MRAIIFNSKQILKDLFRSFVFVVAKRASDLLGLVLGLMFGTLIFASSSTDVQAHSLTTRMVYMFFDANTQQFMDDRIDADHPSGTPLLKNGDELGVIIKVIPTDGTDVGVGGHVTFYVPDGVEVIDAAYLLPGDADPSDTITGYDKVPMKGQSLITMGDGNGATITSELLGLPAVGPNILGVTELPVDADGRHRGTISGVYGDTGIFYSTDPDTAHGSWHDFAGTDGAGTAFGVNDQILCGTLSSHDLFFSEGYVTPNGATITNNNGDTFVPCNKWDAEQMYAFGVGGGTDCSLTGCTATPIVDYGDGRGNAPWGFASAVAGPESGYAWNFDWDEYVDLGANDPADMRAAMSNDDIGPWKRIKYFGSQVSLDTPYDADDADFDVSKGLSSTDANDLGYTLSAANPLPVTTDQTDASSTKAVRWAVGQLTLDQPEYVWVKFRVTDVSSSGFLSDSCPVLEADTFGGDAGGSSNGKDHLWRYYDPTRIGLNLCTALAKPTDLAAASIGDTVEYKVKMYNAGATELTGVKITETFLSDVNFISADPEGTLGDTDPATLVWDIGILKPGERFEAIVTVEITGSGVVDNLICVESNELATQCSSETVTEDLPIMRQSKTASSDSVTPGGTIDYTITLDNIGSAISDAPVDIREDLPTGFTYDSLISVELNGVSVISTTTVDATDPNQPLFAVQNGVAAGQSLILTFRATATNAEGKYCNSYTAWYGGENRGKPQGTGSLACVNVGGGIIGDTIFRDWNANGIQDAADEGITGITIELQDGTCTLGINCPTDITDADGKYTFVGLAQGTYTVVVTNPPANYTPAADPDVGTAHQSQVVLAESEQNLDQDFGYSPGGIGTIGDLVWHDNGASGGGLGDGVKDASELGVSGVTVTLYEDTNNNGVIDTEDAQVATTTTDVSGTYVFTGLDAALNYIVTVDPTDSALEIATGAPALASTATQFQRSPNSNTADFGFWFVQQLTKSVDKTTAVAGDILQYTLLPYIPGSNVQTGVTVSDSAPTGTTYVSSSPAGTGSVSWDLGSNVAGMPGVVVGAVSQSVTVDLPAVKDTYVNQKSQSANTNYGGVAELKLKRKSNEDKLPLFQFDITPIPASATISSASLNLVVEKESSDHSATVRQITSAWDETDTSWNNQPMFNTTADYGTFSPSSTGNISVSVTSLVRAWKGGTANNGLLLEPIAPENGDSFGNGESKFFSKEESGEEPILRVTYDELVAGGISSTNTLSADAALISPGNTVTVTQTVLSQDGDTQVCPAGPVSGASCSGSLTATVSGGAAVSCSAPTPNTPQTIGAGDSADFTWVCTVNNGGTPQANVTFKATPDGANGDYAEGQSNSVLLSPPLTFNVMVNSPSSVAQVDNIGQLEYSGLTPIESNKVITSLGTPSFTVEKEVDVATMSAPGTLNYTIRVKNTGNTT
ncbi:MAG: putative repeat protein (TIGR01451 family), partial [Arenicella sp.]